MSPSYSDKHEHMTPAQQAAQDERAESDKRTGIFESAQRAGAPLNDLMTRLIAEELPLLDSASRQRVYDILRAYDGPEITSQAELPEDIIDIMDLY